MPQLLSICLSLVLSLTSLSLCAAVKELDAQSYGFPLMNPFSATIAGTPTQLMPELPDYVSIKQKDYTLRLQPERENKLPKNFWPVKNFTYRLAKQDHPAPLIFVIAGTGAHFSATSMEYLKMLFYGAGFHVVQISSPTSYDFIASAAEYATPGFTPLDAKDIYRVMQHIQWQQEDLPVTDYYLTGYSLGALEAAFVDKLDQRKQLFNFKRTLLINPPVNLYASVHNLDRMVEVKLEKNDQSQSFYDLLLEKLTQFFQNRGHLDFSQAVLYDFQKSSQRLSNADMAMLIGSQFRLFAADISFTSDLINRRGLITPLNARITDSTSLTPFLKKAIVCNFECYLHQQLLPFWQIKHNGSNLDDLIAQASLPALQDYLANSSHIAVMHNANDPILTKGDLGFLRQTFNERLYLYPNGGHLGNLTYKVNANHMLEFLGYAK
ncbi:serine/threonine protein kinase [Thiopseudomonas alkaliphila]|uniref:serine/threonine protein kinase n=1 Tax=Thiopseudomonas alkaliphila TaxID=1697053 RepID=UPI00069FF2B7|nr:serine/threonine protein kinase [Thiopseudomonas alkaliphila]AKX45564.1 serine/threonine protein kinase [Thiopseudomonas alkaliphila]